jgi:Leucine-rich repeat (LRR) protein
MRILKATMQKPAAIGSGSVRILCGVSAFWIGVVLLFGCTRARPQSGSDPVKPGSSEYSVAKSALKQPAIWNGKIFYNGQSVGIQPPDSMLFLIGLYSDQDLYGVNEILWSGCRFRQIEGLDRLPNVKTLDLMGNKIETIAGIEKAPQLEVVNLSQNRIERIEGLAHLSELRELYLGRNRIRTIEGLDGLKELEVLMLEGNEIEEVSGLSHLKSLKRLGLAGNRLRNITALGELTSLQEVSIESPRNQLDEASLRFIEEWNAEHAGKPALQLHSGASTAVTQEEAQVSTEPEAPEPP